MRTLTKLLAATALAAGLSVAASANAAIFIGVSSDGGATITTVATGAANAFVGGLTYGTFTLNNISASLGFMPDLLDSNSLNTSSTTAGTLDVYILATGFDASTGANGFISSLTSNSLPAGWSVTEKTFMDNTNVGGYAAGVTMASHMFNAIGTSVISDHIVAGSTYALTEQYHIVATGAGNANSTIDVFSAGVPEPATWAMMLAGFGGMGAMLRSRRRAAAVAA